jgi:CBS domain-containing protein
MALTASDVMTKSVVTATPSMSVDDVAKLLAERGISGVPVLGDDKRVIGIITEADILSRKRNQTTVRSLMSTEIIAVGEDEPVSEVAFLLWAKRINRVPVLRDGELVGIVSRADVVRAMADVALASMAGDR